MQTRRRPRTRHPDVDRELRRILAVGQALLAWDLVLFASWLALAIFINVTDAAGTNEFMENVDHFALTVALAVALDSIEEQMMAGARRRLRKFTRVLMATSVAVIGPMDAIVLVMHLRRTALASPGPKIAAVVLTGFYLVQDLCAAVWVAWTLWKDARHGSIPAHH